MFYIFKATSLPRETFKKVLKYLSYLVFLYMGWYSNLITYFAMLGQDNFRKPLVQYQCLTGVLITLHRFQNSRRTKKSTENCQPSS